MKFANRMNEVKASAIRSVGKIIAQKKDVISFAAGLPDPSLFPFDEIYGVTDKILKENPAQALQYGPTQGHGPLIDKIVELLQERDNVSARPENIIVTTGSQQGISFCAMMMIDPGDVIITENPSYLGAINAFRPYQCSFVGVDVDENGMIMEELEKALKENPKAKMIYVIPNFQNPTGKTWSEERCRKLVELANKYNVMVIEDDPYGQLRFKGEKVPTLKSMDTKGKVISLGSFSKVLCPGLRVAWICADKEIIEKVELLKQGVDLQSNQLAQMQVCEFLESYDFEGHIEKIRAAYGRKCNLMIETMKREFPEEAKYVEPEGGMFVWVELPEHIDANELFNKAIEKNVAFVPGESFYPNSDCKSSFRLNFTTTPEDRIEEGVKILAGVIKDCLNDC
ncbi:2-aminoadipate transaminase [Peptoclostridium litorale DSM 5388]|uniref:Putative aminotransferase n=1 Tax=Peptoclostridium litorale DSM 5388 TaxID=1121324 RepID=A0A069RQN5_PEPLI|nr:PLP-dependent aminotransferase family protein [Peptoclostridium litorale]KDR96487.1 putative aminotransferase [Peptoclostridium litorale DSM 5388]SIN70015.1 2-aminoadipate transaminase [Peptoclostridium litorale DSM 5388]